MAKKKVAKKAKAKRPKKYEKSTLKIEGSLEDVLKASLVSVNKK